MNHGNKLPEAAKTLSDVMAALRAPFPPGEEQYRAGPCWEQQGVRFTRPLPYIDARAVFERLDEVVGPDGWATELERLGPGTFLCKLRVLGVARTDVGMAGEHESEKDKSAASDAIKRAAVQFGIGRYLYGLDLPPVKMERRGSDWVLPRGWRPPDSTDSTVGEPIRIRSAARAATPAQLKKIEAELARKGWTLGNIDQLLGGKEPATLSTTEASKVIDHLLASGSPGNRAG